MVVYTLTQMSLPLAMYDKNIEYNWNLIKNILLQYSYIRVHDLKNCSLHPIYRSIYETIIEEIDYIHVKKAILTWKIIDEFMNAKDTFPDNLIREFANSNRSILMHSHNKENILIKYKNSLHLVLLKSNKVYRTVRLDVNTRITFNFMPFSTNL